LTLSRPIRHLVRWLGTHDPGAVERWRAADFGLALVVTILVAGVTNAYFGFGLAVPFPMFAGLVAGNMLYLLTPARADRELGQLAGLAAVMIGWILLIAALDPTAWPNGLVALKLMMVPLTFVALYVRRYGPQAQSIGIAAFIAALMTATLDPNRHEALLFAVAAAEGAVIAIAVRMALHRQRALAGFTTTVSAERTAVATTLNALGNALATAATPGGHAADAAAARLRAIRTAAATALREAPSERLRIDVSKSLLLRMEIGAALAADRIAEAVGGGPLPSAVRDAMLGAVRVAEGWVRASAAARPVEAARVRAAMATARDVLLAPAAAEAPWRDPLLVALAGLDRAEFCDGALVALEAGTAEPVPPVAGLPEAIETAPGLRPTTRVAIQGLVATTVTTALDLGIGLSHAYWATLTVAFVLGGSVGETVGRVRSRLAGTVVGVLVGIAMVWALDGNVALLAGLCILATMVSLVTLRERYDVSAATLAFAFVIGLHLVADLGTVGMLSRIYETAIGAAVALAAARLVLPVYLADPTARLIAGLLARCRAVMAAQWPAAPPQQPCELASTIVGDFTAFSERLPSLNAESVLGRRSTSDLVRIVTLLDAVTSYVLVIQTIATRLAVIDDTPAVRAVAARLEAELLAAFDAALAGRPDAIAPGAAAALAPPGVTPRAAQSLAEYGYFAAALARALHGIAEAMAAADPAPARPPA